MANINKLSQSNFQFVDGQQVTHIDLNNKVIGLLVKINQVIEELNAIDYFGDKTVLANTLNELEKIKQDFEGLDIEALRSDIEANRLLSIANKTLADANQLLSTTNQTSIETNKTSIEENKTLIDTNKTSIQENKASIEENKTLIEINQISINTNKTLIDTNKTDISNLTSQIATNKDIQDIKNTSQDNRITELVTLFNTIDTYVEFDESTDAQTIIVRVNDTLDTKAEWETNMQRIVLKTNKVYSSSKTIVLKVFKGLGNLDDNSLQFTSDIEVYDLATAEIKTSGTLVQGNSYIVNWDEITNKMRLVLEEENSTAVVTALSSRVDVLEDKTITNLATINSVKQTVTENTALIDTNKTSIDTNKTLIDTNKTLIDTNKTLIDTNKTSIDTNKQTTTDNTAKIDENRSNIISSFLNIGKGNAYSESTKHELDHLESVVGFSNNNLIDFNGKIAGRQSDYFLHGAGKDLIVNDALFNNVVGLFKDYVAAFNQVEMDNVTSIVYKVENYDPNSVGGINKMFNFILEGYSQVVDPTKFILSLFNNKTINLIFNYDKTTGILKVYLYTNEADVYPLNSKCHYFEYANETANYLRGDYSAEVNKIFTDNGGKISGEVVVDVDGEDKQLKEAFVAAAGGGGGLTRQLLGTGMFYRLNLMALFRINNDDLKEGDAFQVEVVTGPHTLLTTPLLWMKSEEGTIYNSREKNYSIKDIKVEHSGTYGPTMFTIIATSSIGLTYENHAVNLYKIN